MSELKQKLFDNVYCYSEFQTATGHCQKAFVKFFSKFYIHMLRYHLNTDVKQCANNADTQGCPDYSSLREA